MLKPRDTNSRTHWLPIKDRKTAASYGTRYWSRGREVSEDLKGDDSAIIMDRALAFIEKKPQEKFFSVIWFHTPHLPVVASDADRKPFSHLSPYHQSYFGSLSALDRQVARLRTRLRELEIAENTMICFCSDNGPEGSAKAPGRSGGLRGRKRSLYEGGIRVPGIIEWPAGIKAGLVSQTVSVTSDYFPTIVELTGGQLADRPYDGSSLVPLFQNPESQRSGPVFFETGKMAAVIQQEFKLIAHLDKSKSVVRVELYNLSTDQDESEDLSDRMPERTKKMRQALGRWRLSHKRSLSGADYSPDSLK